MTNAEILRKELQELHVDPGKLHVHFDMDGTLYEWKNLTVDIPSDYEDMDPESRNIYMQQEIYKQLLTPGYYQNLALHPAMAELMTTLHDAGVDVWVNSCSINSQTDNEKRIALSRDFPWLAKDHILFVPDGLGREKATFIDAVAYSDHYILIDDHTANCEAFAATALACGLRVYDCYTAMKCKNDINCKGGKWNGPIITYNDANFALYQFFLHVESLTGDRERRDGYADQYHADVQRE